MTELELHLLPDGKLRGIIPRDLGEESQGLAEAGAAGFGPNLDPVHRHLHIHSPIRPLANFDRKGEIADCRLDFCRPSVWPRCIADLHDLQQSRDFTNYIGGLFLNPSAMTSTSRLRAKLSTFLISLAR